MTLLTTEIAVNPEPAVVFAADRRLSMSGRRHADRRKILPFPSGRLGVGYFGLAEIPGQRGRRRWMDEWLGDFINRHSADHRIGNVAAALAADLNRDVPLNIRRTVVSGFHLAGLRLGDDAPEFWAVSNRMADGVSINRDGYSEHDDFQGRDSANLPPGHIQVYRNGDIQVHAQTWQMMDTIFGPALQLPGFVTPQGPRGHMLWVRFKMEAIVRFYEQFSEPDIIGHPVDAFVITRTGINHAGRRRDRTEPSRHHHGDQRTRSRMSSSPESAF